MARDAVTIMDLVNNGGTVAATTAINAANGAKIAAGGKFDDLVIVVKNTGGTAGTASIIPGTDPVAWRQGMGTVDVTVPLTSGERVIMVESARFAQSDGSIYVDFSPAQMTGTIAAYRLPADR